MEYVQWFRQKRGREGGKRRLWWRENPARLLFDIFHFHFVYFIDISKFKKMIKEK